MPGLLYILAVQILHLSCKLLDESLLYILMDKNIVRCDAGLAGVQRLAPCNAAGSYLKVCTLVYYAGTLATQLQNHRGEMLSCSSHNLTTQCRASGKEYHVKTAAKKYLIDLTVSLYYSNVILAENRLYHLLQSCRNGWHIW